MFKTIITLFILFVEATGFSYAQQIKGTVVEWDSSMQMEMPLVGANVHWVNNTVAASADGQGNFSIDIPNPLPLDLVFSYVGYVNDTVKVANDRFIKVLLKRSIELSEVTVKGKQGTTTISTIQPLNTERLNEGEILKAACCNLSEAFETNPTINVSYKDAVTGAKEIQLLGLSGIYSQLLMEAIPNMRGLASIYGLTFIPGPWMESIQITKGSGSVLNGFESTTGQINVEFKKPHEKATPRFYLNVFGEENTNKEVNTFFKHKFNSKWSSVLMTHWNDMRKDWDRNHDGFRDVPHSNQINLYNRWQYNSGKHLESQIGLKYINDEREGGRIDRTYISDIKNERIEVFGKLGIVFPEKPYMSIGNILQFTRHNLHAFIGSKSYNGWENAVYLQSIYQSILGNTDHQYKIGFTYQHDGLHELYVPAPWIDVVEKPPVFQDIPGVFAEYTYSYLEKLKLVAGLREDYHNNYNWIFTPRVHAKYNFSDDLITRISAGKSFRVPYPYADNLSLLSTSREIKFDEKINPEEAWNYGINFTQRWAPEFGEGTLTLDLYRTDFQNQLIADQYTDTAAIHFYNLKGKSYANSFQVTLNQEFFERMNVRMAYKKDDVKITYAGELRNKPLIAQDRALLNIGYETSNFHWRFDYTLVREGHKQLITYIVDSKSSDSQSPPFYVMNAQVTKVFKKFEVYAGAENFLDYRQMNPIIHPEDPFSNQFDATQIWGPIEGRRIYAGLRYSFK